jgi:cytoskeletal protein RodZ
MKVQVRAALAIAVLALVAAVSGVGGALAGQVLITGKQIKNGSLTTQDYRSGSVRASDVQNDSIGSTDLQNEGVQSTDLSDGGVQSADLQNGGVQSADIEDNGIHTQDIGTNQVQASDLELPDPQQTVEPGTASANVGDTFASIDLVETYVKEDPTSILEVTWTGSASAGFSPCQFQIRVDGQPAAGGAGALYVANGTTNGNVMISVDFMDLPAGPHEVSVYGRAVGAGESTFPCTVGPEAAQLQQTFVVAEQVV